jgi:nicotinamidase/pyrazinamidase
MRNALLAVDLQVDFISGSLPVPNGLHVAAQVARHIRHFRSEYVLVVASRDYHEDPAGHFSTQPDYRATWPPHCVIGTPGAAFVPPIANLVREKFIQVVVSKGRHEAAYSAFEGIDNRGHPLYDVLRESRIDHLDICGLATDYCVCASALDARKHGFQVRILINLCGGVNDATTLQAIEAMQAAGCTLQTATAP